MRWVSAGEKVMGLFGTAPRYREFYVLFERAGHNVEKATGAARGSDGHLARRGQPAPA